MPTHFPVLAATMLEYPGRTSSAWAEPASTADSAIIPPDPTILVQRLVVMGADGLMTCSKSSTSETCKLQIGLTTLRRLSFGGPRGSATVSLFSASIPRG